MNQASANVLDGLRAYHLPEPISWWPPAPGWWLLAGIFLIGLVSAVWLLWRRHQQRAVMRATLLELDRIAQAPGDDPASSLRHLSKLLRRFALARFPEDKVAGLTGTAWLEFLNSHSHQADFITGKARLLEDAPYQAVCDPAAVTELTGLVRSWVLHNKDFAS